MIFHLWAAHATETWEVIWWFVFLYRSTARGEQHLLLSYLAMTLFVIFPLIYLALNPLSFSWKGRRRRKEGERRSRRSRRRSKLQSRTHKEERDERVKETEKPTRWEKTQRAPLFVVCRSLRHHLRQLPLSVSVFTCTVVDKAISGHIKPDYLTDRASLS